MNTQSFSDDRQNESYDGELEAHPTKKLKLTEEKSIEFPAAKDFKGDKVLEEKVSEKLDIQKSMTNFNIVNIDKQDPSHYKEYKRLKYKNIIYNLNDILMIRNCEDANNDFVGILRKIIKVVIENNVNILIEVQWYCF